MRVIVCGGRNFMNAGWVFHHLAKYDITELAQGGATGVDYLAKNYATKFLIPQKEYKADWDKYGRAAGPVRNEEMLLNFKPDKVIAFRTGSGKGTQNMIDTARKYGYEVIEVSGV